MRTTILIATMMMFLITLAVAQMEPLPPTTIVGAGFAHGTQDSIGKVHEGASAANPFFCPPQTCLYYSGDYDAFSPDGNGVFDFENPGIGITDAEVWVGVRPLKDAVVTGSSGNFYTDAVSIGTNPTPFMIRTGISSGNAGRLVCSTTGVAVYKIYQDTNIGFIINYSIEKLTRPCHLKAHKIYYIRLTPQYNDSGTVGYLMDDDGAHANKQGWPEIKDKSYFNSTSFGITYEPTWGNGGACGGIGCSGFSISLTGKQQ